MPSVILELSQSAIKLKFDADWLQLNPLTIADLEREQEYLRGTDYELKFT